MKKFNSEIGNALMVPISADQLKPSEFEFNNNIIVIEDNVPVVYLRTTKWAALDQIVSQLLVKQSFMVPFAFDVSQKERMSCKNAVVGFFKKRKWDVTTGICYDKNSRPIGIRFWRLR